MSAGLRSLSSGEKTKEKTGKNTTEKRLRKRVREILLKKRKEVVGLDSIQNRNLLPFFKANPSGF